MCSVHTPLIDICVVGVETSCVVEVALQISPELGEGIRYYPKNDENNRECSSMNDRSDGPRNYEEIVETISIKILKQNNL